MHPFLMVAGFIYFMGQAMLVYRTGTCCRRIYTKLVHTGFHLLAIPCIALGFVAVWDYKSLRTDETTGDRKEVPHFYSIHSWLGLATMGMFALQVRSLNVHFITMTLFSKIIINSDKNINQ